MRFGRFPRHRRPLFAFGVLTVCAITTAATVPAYAGPAPQPSSRAGSSHTVSSHTVSSHTVSSHTVSSHAVSSHTVSTRAESPNDPVSGRAVAGAMYGAAATRAAGPAAADFLRVHRTMLAQVHQAVHPAGHRAPGASATFLHNWWGSFPDTDSGPGVTATQSVSQSLRLTHSSDILYAPTMTPANHSCIEVVTVHTTHTPQIWAWDWCKFIRPVAVVNVNAAFMKTYTTIANGRTAYTTEDVKTNAKTNSWTAYLFNYLTGSWGRLYTQAGTDQSGLTFGWDMFEFYSSTNPATGNTYVCGDLQKAGTNIESSNISIRHDGNWVPANSTDSSWNPSAHPSPSQYKCPDIKFAIIQPNSNWRVHVAS